MTKMNVCLTAVTLFMFLLSTAHIIMVIRFANIAYLKEDAANKADMVLHIKHSPADYLPTVFVIFNVSFLNSSIILLIFLLIVLCRRCHCAVAGMGIVGKDLEVSCDSVDCVVGKHV
jgi:hypothetical protein